MQEDKVKELPKDSPHPPKPHEIPPHILKEFLDLKEKVGKLEGKVEVLQSLVESVLKSK